MEKNVKNGVYIHITETSYYTREIKHNLVINYTSIKLFLKFQR